MKKLTKASVSEKWYGRFGMSSNVPQIPPDSVMGADDDKGNQTFFEFEENPNRKPRPNLPKITLKFLQTEPLAPLSIIQRPHEPRKDLFDSFALFVREFTVSSVEGILTAILHVSVF